MTGDVQENPAAARAAPDGVAPDRRQVADELAHFSAVLKILGPADPAVEPGVDLRRRLVRAAAT